MGLLDFIHPTMILVILGVGFATVLAKWVRVGRCRMSRKRPIRSILQLSSPKNENVTNLIREECDHLQLSSPPTG